MKKLLFGFIILIFGACLFCACAKEEITVNYVCDDGGYIIGNTNQTIEIGGNCSYIFAIADEGYRFTGWSDGLTSPYRTDTKVEESKTLTAHFEKIEYVTVNYVASEGGYICGNLKQTVEVGSDCSQVSAIADEGYRFTGWSDGLTSPYRTDTKVEESKTLTAHFEKIEYVTVNYVASEGGFVYGNLIQTVEAGNDCTLVYAVADNGYRFVEWSDGLKTAQRLDVQVFESQIITARFEKINVLFYSDNLLVRQYALSDFKTLDISKIVGYASCKTFAGWEFIGYYVGYNGADPLPLIKTYFTAESDIPDITLNAVYENKEGSGPQDYKTIAYGLGGLNGKAYINSKQSFEYYYNLGQRFFEADINITLDNKIVVDHDVGPKNYTYEQFKARATEGYTPLDLDDFLNLVNEYSDVTVDLDVLSVYYGNNAEIDENYRILFSEIDRVLRKIDSTASLYDRLILEILPNSKTEMFNIAKEYCSFNNFLYAEYYDSTSPINDDNIVKISEWCVENGVFYLSIGNVTKKWVEIFHSYGIYVAVFTYNDPIVMYNYFDLGVDCIFTDFTFM